jgi:hypothetical protein
LSSPPKPARKTPERIISGWVDKDGYINICLSKFGVIRKHKVHRIVLMAFAGKCPEGMEVNHKNGVRNDNRLENLEYVTHRENELHAIHFLGKKTVGSSGSKNGRSILTDSQVLEIVRLLDDGYVGQKDIAKMYAVKPSVISKINTGTSWSKLTKRGQESEAFEQFVLKVSE